MVFKTDFAKCRSKVLQIAPREHSALLLTFIKLPFAVKTFDLSTSEWPLMISFTVYLNLLQAKELLAFRGYFDPPTRMRPKSKNCFSLVSSFSLLEQ